MRFFQLAVASAVATNTWLLLGIMAAGVNIPNTVAKLTGQECDCVINPVWYAFDRYLLFGDVQISLSMLIISFGSAVIAALLTFKSPQRVLERRRYFHALRIAALRGEALALIVVAGIVAYHFWTGGQFFYTAPAASAKPFAPDFRFQLTNGTVLNLYSLSAKPILLEFFATGCSHCQAEVAELRQVYDHFGGKVVLLSITTTWSGDTLETCRRFVSSFGAFWLTGIDLGRGTTSYNVHAVPQLFLIDKQNRVSHIHVGVTSAGVLIQELATLLKE